MKQVSLTILKDYLYKIKINYSSHLHLKQIKQYYQDLVLLFLDKHIPMSLPVDIKRLSITEIPAQLIVTAIHQSSTKKNVHTCKYA